MIQGFTSQYIIINEISLVKIICTKNQVLPDSLYTLVNTNQVTTPSVCNAYTNGNCLSEAFTYDLSTLDALTNYYQFDCGLIESSNIFAPSLVLRRLCKIFKFSIHIFYIIPSILVIDNKPRIRNGLSLNSIINVQPYDISITTISCETITNDLSIVNGVQFYTISLNRSASNSFNMYSTITHISTNLYNLSIIFQLSTYNAKLYSPNSNYMCCSTNRGISTGSCTQVYLESNSLNINTNSQSTDMTITKSLTVMSSETAEEVARTDFNVKTEPKLDIFTQSYIMIKSTGTAQSNYIYL